MPSTYQYPRTEFDTPVERRKINRRRRRGYYSRQRRLIHLGIALSVILADRLSKILILLHLKQGTNITIFPHVLRLSHVHNFGAAFSLFAENASPLAVRRGLIAFSVAAVLMVFAMLWRTGRQYSLTSIALALILGGAVGNLWDRIHYSYVVDFIEVTIIRYHWPDFNIADSAIVIGACLLLLEIFRPQTIDPATISPSPTSN